MNMRLLRFSSLMLVASLCATLFLAPCEVSAQHPEGEYSVETEQSEEMPVEAEQPEEMMVEAKCNTENGECLNPEAEAAATTKTTTNEEDPNCPSREYVIRCAGIHLDVNKNGLLERVELQTAIDKLPWYGRGIIKILGSVDKMMNKCDIDGDGAISMDYDMSNNGHQCLATCFKRRAFKGAFFPDCE